MPAYSLADVESAIEGPGGSFQIGAGIGLSTEGINIEPKGDTNILTEGGDGEIMHSLRVSKACTITITVLKTSPTNARLMNLYNYQASSSRYWGQNTVTVINPVSGDVHNCTQIAFQKKPGVPYAEDGGTIVWTLEGKVSTKLGGETEN
jgi:Protein of unknown function (DUF3277).